MGRVNKEKPATFRTESRRRRISTNFSSEKMDNSPLKIVNYDNSWSSSSDSDDEFDDFFLVKDMPSSQSPKIGHVDFARNSDGGDTDDVEIVQETENTSQNLQGREQDDQPSPPTVAIPCISTAEQHSGDTGNDQDDTSDEEPPNKKSRTKYALTIKQMQKTPSWPFIRAMGEFFTRKINLVRFGPAVSQATLDKILERIRGFCGYLSNVLPSFDDIKPDVFNNQELIEGYLAFLKDIQGLADGSIVNHIQALLYPIKYIHRDQAVNRYADVSLIARLKKQQNWLSTQGMLSRPKTVEELSSQERWLTWEQVLECVRKQKIKVEQSEGKTLVKELQSLALLSLYVFLPPSRGHEIRTLKFYRETKQCNFIQAEHPGENILLEKNDGNLQIIYQQHKTSKFRGPESMLIQKDTELCRILKDYLKQTKKQGSSQTVGDVFVFLNSSDQPFSSPAFTKWLQRIFRQLSGCTIGINTLRSSFITHVYSKSDVSDSLRRSIADCQRHSLKQAEAVYDRRSSSQRKEQGIAYARNIAEQNTSTDQSDQGPSVSPTERDDSTQSARKFKAGDFVAVVESDSALNKPKILLGRVLFHDTNNSAHLLHYEQVKGNTYRLSFDGIEPWKEDPECFVRVKVKMTGADTCRLETSVRSIHKSVFS